ncbi:Nicastrin-domain-containing protein [Piromyces finnis]|uniref:Nicastrin n=1 Tax=Piromyces finnis TaxID=1754191 RepID=A0A1Y1VNJ5_9FUNG|nr:Nicastrin-domain-containing protein [Piromyces finnis]|eukprot:ORX60984.1 Nicastrin-domain-containing protein [Piromyces finnis]
MEQELNNVVFPKYLNATSEIGSKSSSSASIIYRISTNEEFEIFKKSNLKGKFAVVLQADLINKKNLRDLEATNKVEGLIVIYDDTKEPVPYSPDKECPNCEFGMYTEGEKANYKWNPYGDGLLYEYFSFPIYGMSLDKPYEVEGVNAIIKADEFNKKRNYKKYPLYSIKFDSFMYASKNSETCLSRDHCDPIGGNSVWGTYSKQINPDDGKKIVIVSSQIDGNSLFHDNTIGTNSQIGGFVANLAIADALSKSEVLPEQFQNHIVFTFFSGESYGYGGSQRFVKDISSYECKSHDYNSNYMCSQFSSCQDPCMYVDDFKNITLNNIKGIIELNQLTCSGCDDINNPAYYMHVDDETDPETLKITNLISRVYSTYEDSYSSYNIKPAWEGLEKNLGLPPASAQSFLKKQKIPAVVIGDFQTEYTNKHYHSGFDVESDSVKYDNTVCKTADIIAKAIWLYAQNKESDLEINSIPPSVSVDCQYVNDLIHCLSNNITCSLTSKLIASNNGATLNSEVSKISHYSGVFNGVSLSGAINSNYNYDSWIANYAIIKSTGRNTTIPCTIINDCLDLEYPNYKDLDKDAKAKIDALPYSLRNYQCILGYCIEGRSYAHPAYGIGIEHDAKKDLFYINDRNLPNWTESRWDKNRLTIYFVSSKTFQFIELLIGILSIILTICGYYYIKNYAKRNMKIA